MNIAGKARWPGALIACVLVSLGVGARPAGLPAPAAKAATKETAKEAPKDAAKEAPPEAPDAGTAVPDKLEPKPPAEEPGLPGSPRATVYEWLRIARAGNFEEAARFLDLGEDNLERGPELARRLKGVLDRYTRIELDKLSPNPDGSVGSGRPRQEVEVARIPGPSGSAQPVRLTREIVGDSGWWRFSRGTVDQIDVWYSTLRNRWILDVLPAPLLRMGPGQIVFWQWVALFGMAIGAWLAGLVLARISQRALAYLARRTTPPWDDRVVGVLFGPLATFWLLGLVRIGVPFLALYEPAQREVFHFLRLIFISAVLWTLLRAINEIGDYLHDSPWARASPASRALIPLGSTLSKVALSTIAMLALLNELGYSVSSVVAGLGIGGLALAFGAQKTVENLFGALSIGIDQPFRAGDFVSVDGFSGTVELIGLRSTRVRTLDRTLITIPNGKLAELKIETMAARDRFRMSLVLGLTYDTTAKQLRSILSSLERMLRDDPKVWPDVVTVVFTQFAASSLDVEVTCWLLTSDGGEFVKLRQEVLFKIMEIIEKEGAQFAFPTRTLHVSGELAQGGPSKK